MVDVLSDMMFSTPSLDFDGTDAVLILLSVLLPQLLDTFIL